MDFADLYMRHLSSYARWRELPWPNRDHFVTLLGKALLRPARDTRADKKKTGNAYSYARYQTREEERDPESKKYRPRRAGRHRYGLSLTLFRSAVIHHKSPSNQVNDCKHHDPHCIHEVPIEGDHAEAFTLPRVNPTKKRDRKSTRLNSSHSRRSRMPSSA